MRAFELRSKAYAEPKRKFGLQKHLGAHAELIACTWLLEQGYEVFRNVSAHGEIDIVAIRAGETLLIDVKHCKMKFNSDASCSPTRTILKPKQIAMGIRPLYVTLDGLCSFSAEVLAAVSTENYGLKTKR